MSEYLCIKLSRDNDLTVDETVTLDNERIVQLHRSGNHFDEVVMLPSEAQALGLALIRMAEVSLTKDRFPQHFGESATSEQIRVAEGRGSNYTGRHARNLDSLYARPICRCGNRWPCRHAFKKGKS